MIPLSFHHVKTLICFSAEKGVFFSRLTFQSMSNEAWRNDFGIYFHSQCYLHKLIQWNFVASFKHLHWLQDRTLLSMQIRSNIISHLVDGNLILQNVLDLDGMIQLKLRNICVVLTWIRFVGMNCFKQSTFT